MRKLGIFILGASLSFAFTIYTKSGITASAEENGRVVYVGGMAAGFTLKTGSAQIIGTCDVLSEDGCCSPAGNAGLRPGDCIVKAGGIEVETIAELNEIVNKSKGKALNFEIVRGEERISCSITPKKEKTTNKYKIGVLVRDCVSGVGTITYLDKESGRFGALGHSVENENKKELKVLNGIVYQCSIVGVTKGVRGRAGELRGMFLTEKTIGEAEKLTRSGIFGEVDDDFFKEKMDTVIASSSEAKPGNAYIYSTISGICPEKYEIEVVKVDKNNKENKNFVIKITDNKLLEETGGIVQGMSGSPIIQEGKMIGAVTHVFLNDPTRGYGIKIDAMLCE
jgi:stage IV sporulation protein B